MLGLLRGSHGHDAVSIKSGAREPVVSEIIPSSSSDDNESIDGDLEAKDTVGGVKTTVMKHSPLSPTPSMANSVRFTKRSSSYMKSIGAVRSSFGRFSYGFVREQNNTIREKCHRELGAGVGSGAFDTSFEGLRDWIKSERLTRLPHKGGSWDRVLISAQYFAEQVNRFNRNIEEFTEESGAAANLVFGQCLLLLELGHENARALEKAFSLFYQFGLELAPLLKRGDVFAESQSIMEDLGKAFADLLQIVAGISITFYQAVHSGRSSTKIDIFASFSSIIEIFRARVHKCSHEMWNIILANYSTDGCQVDLLQKWLAPQDSVLAFLSSNHISLAVRPEELTCTWFQSPLNSFLKSNDNILLVEGKTGSGKTTLASWVIDRLQRPIGRKHVSPISFFFDCSIAAQETPLAMLQTLLHQLLTARIGDIHLFKAVNEIYLESKNLLTAEQQEAKLWSALTKALHAINEDNHENLVIIIDGVYETDGNKTAVQKTCQKLYDLANKFTAVRFIQFSQPLGLSPQSAMRVELSMETMLDDLRTMVRSKISTHEHFRDRDLDDQESIVEQLVEASDGSMLWASLTCKYLRLQENCKDFDNAIKAVVGSPKTITEAVRRHLITLKLNKECKTLLSLLVAAERPFQFAEVEALLRADPDHFTLSDRSIDISLVMNHISAFTTVGEGLISFRHTAIKQAVIAASGDAKVALHLKDRHKDFVSRLLIYAKTCLQGEHDPTLKFLEASQAQTRLSSHRLLEYTVRYWAIHFKKSSLFKAQGDLHLDKEFKKIFPASVSFCLLEQACWNSQSFAHVALDLHSIAFRVRKALFGQDHVCVLQSALFCAILCETVLSRHTEAIEWYTLSAKIAGVVIGVQADITISCCKHVLRISETLVSKKRTSIMTYREEVLLVLVSSYKHRYGTSSKEVLEIYKKLEELYVYIEEETKASEIIEIVQKLTIVIYGGQSDQAEIITRKAEVLLKKHEGQGEIELYDGFLFGGYKEEHEEAWTFARVDIIINLAAKYIAAGHFAKAEELYIELWLKLTEHCRTVRECEWHQKKIEVLLIYARFLEKHHRHSEASAILLAIWSEYEHHEFSMFETVVVLLKEVAVCLKTLGLLTVALTVFRTCWSFFKHQHKETTVIFKEIEEYISQTSTEVVKSTTTVTTSSSETIIREVFESIIESTETVVTATTVELCQSLTKIYFREERWSEAVYCIRKLLTKCWASFFSESIESITLCEHFRAESVQLVIDLALCYISESRYEKAEEIYVRLYRAYRKSCKVDDVSVIKYSEMLIAFYKKHELFTRCISFYQELLVEYRAFFGATHAMTIKILYALGDLCVQHPVNYGYWLEYYLEIVVNLNKGLDFCHEDAFRALVIIAEHYCETFRYSESLVYFKCIFATFCKFGTKYKYFEEKRKVKLLIERYFRSLEESTIDIHVHIIVLKELKKACYEFYGHSHAITILCMFKLAEVCCRSEKYEFEAVALYEHVYEHRGSSEIVEESIVKRTKTILGTLYIKQITSKTSTTTMTTETITRATTFLYERYVHIRKSHACTHETTLAYLKELIMFYHKQKKIDLSLRELRAIVIECVTKVKSARELIESAKFIAAIYIACGLVKEGLELVHAIRLQVIYKSTERCSHVGFDVTSVGRACFAFIASFEYHLRAIYTISIAVYMADLIAEVTFYERFLHCIKTKSKLEQVFVVGGRLRRVLLRTKRLEDFAIIELKTLECFRSSESQWVGLTSESSTKVFVHVLLKHFSESSLSKSWTAMAGHAAVTHLKVLLKDHKHKEAYELAKCSFKFLMAHEGLDDPTEITLGFQLCLMMAGRPPYSYKCSDPAIQRQMMDLSRQILAEVFDICKKFGFNIARCHLSELKELVILVGEQKDYGRLQWLLNTLWTSREGQTSWPPETILYLGKRLVQAQFAAGNFTGAIRLCEDIVYNVRRVHGLRHHHTLSFHALLASMYTSFAIKHRDESLSDSSKNKKRAEEMSRLYFKKAVHVHEEVLKLIINQDDADLSDEDDDDDDMTVDGTASYRGSVHGGSLARQQQPSTVGSTTIVNSCGFAWASKDQEISYVRAHIRRLHLAVQRHGSFPRPKADYERLTHQIFGCYGKDLNMSEDQCFAGKWKVEGYGHGKAEGGLDEDGFRIPERWSIVKV